MRTTALSVLALSLIGAACVSSGEDVVTADDPSAVTVDDAESGIVAQGDTRPADEQDSTSVVSLAIDLPDGVQPAGIVIVALEDVTFADSEIVEIARVELTAADLVARSNRVDMFLPLPLDGSLDVAATAHIDVDENGTFSQGDWISPERVPVTNENAGSVTVIMVQI